MSSLPPSPVDARRVLRSSAAAFALLSVIGVIYATQHWIVGTPSGRLSWPRNLADALIQWWTWAALAPAVLALSSRAPIQPGRQGLGLYVATGVIACTLQLLMVASLLRGFDMVTPGEAFGRTVSNLFRKRIGLDLLTFGSLVLLGHAGVYHARWRGQAKTAERLGAALAERRRPTGPVKLAVRGRNGTVLVDPAQVGWIEAAGNYAVLHAGGGEHMMRATLEELSGQLGDRFVRISRSTLVNLEKVAALGDRSPQGDLTVTLACGERLRLTRTYRSDALERLPRPR